MKNGSTLDELYKERLPLYNKYADITVNCESKTAEEIVTEIVERLCK
jgi:shikimate kinase